MAGPFTDVQLIDYCTEHYSALGPDWDMDAHVIAWKFVSSEDFFIVWSSKPLVDKQLASPLLQVISSRVIAHKSQIAAKLIKLVKCNAIVLHLLISFIG